MKENTHNALIIHAGCMKVSVEILEELISTPQQLVRQWQRYARRSALVETGMRAPVLNTLQAGRIFSSPEETRRFKDRVARKIDGRLNAVLDLFILNPWFYTIFEVESIQSDGLLNIRFHGRDELLFSPEAARAARRGNVRLLGLLFFNGKSMQSWGEMVPLDAFFEEDIHYFAGEIDGDLYREKGVEEVLTAFPLPFYLLKLFSALPQPLLYGEVGRACASSLHCPDFDTEALELCRCRSEKLDNGTMIRLCLGEAVDLRPPTFYFDRESETAILASLTLENYRKARLALAPAIEFPVEPQRMVSGVMQYAVYELCGSSPSWMALDDLFLPPKDSPEGVALLERLEEAVYHCIEKGRTPDIDFVAERSGTDRRSAKVFIDGLATLIGGDVPGLSYLPLRDIQGRGSHARAA